MSIAKLQFTDLDGMNVPRYCRKIMKQENFPEKLEIYRNDVLCLTVDVKEAAELVLVENEKEGPLYRKYRESSFLKTKETLHVPTTG